MGSNLLCSDDQVTLRGLIRNKGEAAASHLPVESILSTTRERSAMSKPIDITRRWVSNSKLIESHSNLFGINAEAGTSFRVFFYLPLFQRDSQRAAYSAVLPSVPFYSYQTDEECEFYFLDLLLES